MKHDLENMKMMFFSTLWDSSRYASLVPKIDPNSNKYSRGSLLVVGGSAKYSGAPILSALAASKAGCGYVSLLAPSSIAQIAKEHLLSIPVLSAIATSSNGDELDEGALDSVFELREKHLNAVVVGPGMGASINTAKLLLGIIEKIECPIVLDADALNVIAGLHDQSDAKTFMEALALRSAQNRFTILTPHDGELKRLVDAGKKCGLEEITDLIQVPQRALDAIALSRFTGAIVLAKGPVSYIVNEERTLESDFGSAALAKAGTGDVLTGIVGSFIAQGVSPFEAAALGACVHGVAGRCAAKKIGEASVMAEDVVDFIAQSLTLVATNSIPKGLDGIES